MSTKVTRNQVAGQREVVLSEHNPHVGPIQSGWVENQGVGASNTQAHPLLSNKIAGAADGLSPVATAPQNAQIVSETVGTHPEKTPVPGPKQQAQVVQAATLSPTPTPGK